MEAKARLVVFYGEAHLVPHEVDVALNGLWGDLEFLGHFPAIGVAIRHEPLVEAHHARERRARVSRAGALALY
jgi:hypothetical protein